MKRFKSLFSSLIEDKIIKKQIFENKKKYCKIDSKKTRRDGQPKTKRCNCARCQKSRQLRMNKNVLVNEDYDLTETIVKSDNKYLIVSKKGKILSKKKSYKSALKRLKQIEYFKNK